MRQPLVWTIALLLCSCSDNAHEAQSTGPPAEITVVGAVQRSVAVTGAETLAVKVRDQNGRPVYNTVVDWRVLEDVPHFFSDTHSLTDEQGVARTLFRADTIAGAVTVEATAIGAPAAARFNITIAPGSVVMKDTLYVALDGTIDTRSLLTDRFGNVIDTPTAWKVENATALVNDGLLLRAVHAGISRISGQYRGADVSTMVKVIGWRDVGVGWSHTCGLLTNGRVVCFGLNYGTPTLIPAPFLETISAADGLTCGLERNGTAWCWGLNDRAQIGDGTTISRNQPTRVATAERFTQIHPGIGGTCALRSDGQAYCWGDNVVGHVGLPGTGDTIRTPVAILQGTRFLSMTRPNGSYTCGVTLSNAVLCWGGQYLFTMNGWTYFQYAPPPWPLGFSASHAIAGSLIWSTCVLTATSEADCWGNNDYGQFGNGTEENVVTAPVRAFSNQHFKQIAMMINAVCGLRENGSTSCWGGNSFGELGRPVSETCIVEFPGGPGARPCSKAGVSPDVPVLDRLVAGGDHICGLTASGHLWCWGNSASRQTGSANPSPHKVPVESSWVN